MIEDPRINVLKNGMRLKHYELQKGEYSTHEYFERMAEEVIDILDDYYGGERYWMASKFEREKIARRLYDVIDDLREGF